MTVMYQVPSVLGLLCLGALLLVLLVLPLLPAQVPVAPPVPVLPKGEAAAVSRRESLSTHKDTM
jgi:hypothetical protein